MDHEEALAVADKMAVGHRRAREDAALVTAYHLVFDVKDGAEPGSDEFVHAFNALAALNKLMDGRGMPSIYRFDAQLRLA